MASIAQHIGTIRGLIKEHSDDSKYSDQFLYEIFKAVSRDLQTAQLLKHWNTSIWNSKRFCLKLEKGLSHDCDCVKVGCEVFKTTEKVPRVIKHRNRDLLKVFALDGTEYDYINPTDQKTALLDDVMSNRINWSLINQKIVLWNTPPNFRHKAILVEGFWYDETDWAYIKYCDTNGNQTDKPCYDITEDDYSLDADLIFPTYAKVLELLGVTLNYGGDQTNDANNEIKS